MILKHLFKANTLVHIKETLAVFSSDYVVALLKSARSADKQLLELKETVRFYTCLLAQLHLFCVAAPENAILIVVIHLVSLPKRSEECTLG